MTKFLIGFILGVSLVTANAVSDGFMNGWTVMYGKRVICEDPWVWHGTKEIECVR